MGCPWRALDRADQPQGAGIQLRQSLRKRAPSTAHRPPDMLYAARRWCIGSCAVDQSFQGEFPEASWSGCCYMLLLHSCFLSHAGHSCAYPFLLSAACSLKRPGSSKWQGNALAGDQQTGVTHMVAVCQPGTSRVRSVPLSSQATVNAGTAGSQPWWDVGCTGSHVRTSVQSLKQSPRLGSPSLSSCSAVHTLKQQGW
jgi:hypothetical protein